MGKYSKKKRNTYVSLCLLLAGLLILTGVWFGSANYRAYLKGNTLYKNGEYEAAVKVYQELSDYKDVSSRLLEARYALYGAWMESERYLDAAQGYAALGNYRDCTEQMEKCYYTLATAEHLKKNYEVARDYFSMAGDYRDAETQVQRMLYFLGHEAFLAGDYETADSWFIQLDGEQETYGAPHFHTLEDAAAYLYQQLEDLSDQVRFHIGEIPDEDFYGKLRNMYPFQTASPSYFDEDKLITILGTEYYTGDKILHAWEHQDMTMLNEEEQQVLELALDLVSQAEAETENELELERWLHDWLCTKVIYESPDMDVNALDYIQLRELNCIGAMLDGKANCQGYTDAFYLLGNLAGLEVRRLSGDAGEGHIWNMVIMNDQWYIVDCTFDDLSDTNYDGWTYTYFNTALDPEVYQIYGGTDVLSGIATEFNLEHTYFGETGSCFDDVHAAADYLVRRYLQHGDGWDYVMIADSQVEGDTFEEALRSSLIRANVTYAEWGELAECYHGNSYISICWV